MSSEQFLDHFLTFKYSPADGPSELFPRSPSSLHLQKVGLFAPGGGGWLVKMAYLTTYSKSQRTPRSLPEYPTQFLGVTPTLCLAGTEACIILEDISYSLLLVWRTDLKRGLSSYNPLELRWMKAVTCGGIWDMKAVEFSLRFKSVYNFFCVLKNGFIWWKYKEILQIEQKLAEDLASSVLPWHIWLLLQAGCSTVKV